MIRTRMISALLSVGLAGGLAGCATHGNPTQQLLDARQAYAVAAASQAPRYAYADLIAAERALNDAELARKEGASNQEQLAFVAKRRAEIATSRAGAAAAAEMAARQARRSTTVRVEVKRDTATAEELARRNAELAAKGEALDETARALQEKEAELAAQAAALEAERIAREKLEKERDEALNKLREFAMVVENERGTVITLGGALLFRTNETVLLPTAQAKLDQVATALQSLQTDQTLVIEGHADSRGSSDFNRRLSSQRAEAVRAYLVMRGVPPEKLTSFGKGEEQPVADNTSAEGRANNRRVEIVISRSKSASK